MLPARTWSRCVVSKLCVTRLVRAARCWTAAAEAGLDGLARRAGAEPLPPATRWLAGSRLSLGALALAAIPLLLALEGGLDRFAAAVLAGLVLQVPAALWALRDGRAGAGQALSLAGLSVAAAGALPAGAPALPLLVAFVLALDAVLLATRPAAAAALLMTLFAVAVLSLGYAAPPQAALALPLGLGVAGVGLAGVAVVLRRAAGAQAALVRAAAEREDLTRLSGGLWLALDTTGHVASADGAPLCALAPGALLGRGLFDRVHVADRPSYLRMLAAARRDGATAGARVRLRVTPDDAVPAFAAIDMMARARVGVDPADGEGAWLVLRDATADVRRESELADARAAQETSARRLQRFLAELGHELRTPLTTVAGFADLAADDAALPGARREQARAIGLAARHAADLTASLEEWATLGAGARRLEREPCAVGEIVAAALAMTTPAALDARVTLEAEVEPDLPALLAERHGLTQVLINLLDNAVRFTPAGGQVRVCARRERGELVVAVEDTGRGMSPEQIARIGEPFLKSRDLRDREGRGLGLAISRGIVALHGGALEFSARAGGGTSAALRLAFVGPAARPDNLVSLPMARDARAPAPAPALVKKRA
jgi:cell cycle sensor histidine kinase DivJ